jgi:acetyl esterase
VAPSTSPNDAPEHPYPAALHSAIDAFDWARHHRHALGFDRGSPSAFVGDSSGAHLATAATLTLTTTRTEDRRPSGLILTHPVLQPGTDTPSHRYYGNGFGLTSRRLEQLWKHYAPNRELQREPAAAPLLATTLAAFHPLGFKRPNTTRRAPTATTSSYGCALTA